jgi:hypothetical protein
MKIENAPVRPEILRLHEEVVAERFQRAVNSTNVRQYGVSGVDPENKTDAMIKITAAIAAAQSNFRR